MTVLLHRHVHMDIRTLNGVPEAGLHQVQELACPSLLQSLRSFRAAKGAIPRGSYGASSQGSIGSAAPAYGHVCSVASMWSLVKASHVRRNRTLYGQWGLHPLLKWQRVSTLVGSTAAHRLARWEGCGPPSRTASRSGRTCRPGWP